jgi:hypothetical protein
MTSPAQEAVTPAGNPIGVPMPVAPVVEIVIAGDNAVFIQTDGDEDGVENVLAVTVIVKLDTDPAQDPVAGTV